MQQQFEMACAQARSSREKFDPAVRSPMLDAPVGG